ncbi:hypothetical protein HanRHA438_Chr13g0582931 [Helianthus annuus]|nr:hypothetical protein HanRHA438_Chr13g0582931 [Helianthus annuus]
MNLTELQFINRGSRKLILSNCHLGDEDMNYVKELGDASPALRGDCRIILNQLKKHYYNFVSKKTKTMIRPFFWAQGKTAIF